MEQIREISRRYGLGAVTAESVRRGTVAAVWRLRDGAGEYLLRTLTGPEQGEMERRIVRHLRSRGFSATPAILETTDGSSMTEIGGTWYQLQTYRPGPRPDPAIPGMPERIAQLAAALTAALDDCPAEGLLPDRFDLAALWARGREGWEALGLPMSLQEADRAVAEAAALPAKERRVVHGDLGPWNMIYTEEGELLVVDFGEAHLADPYFDLAAALGGLRNHCPGEKRDAAAAAFLSECEGLMPGLDRGRLLGQLRLWLWRGLAQCACWAGGPGPDWTAMAGTLYRSLSWTAPD